MLRKLQRSAQAERALQALTFKGIPLDKFDVVILIDARIVANYKKSSYPVVILIVSDKETLPDNALHYASPISKGLCISVPAAENFVLMDWYDVGYSTALTLIALIKRMMKLTFYTDC